MPCGAAGAANSVLDNSPQFPSMRSARRGSWVVSSIAPSLPLFKNDAIDIAVRCNQLVLSLILSLVLRLLLSLGLILSLILSLSLILNLIPSPVLSLSLVLSLMLSLRLSLVSEFSAFSAFEFS